MLLNKSCKTSTVHVESKTEDLGTRVISRLREKEAEDNTRENQWKTETTKHFNKDTVEMATFASLPDSVIIQIFSYLYYPSLVRSTRVCKRWHRLAYDPSLWKSVHIRDKHARKVEADTIARIIPRKTNLISSVYLTNCAGVKDVSLEHIALHLSLIHISEPTRPY